MSVYFTNSIQSKNKFDNESQNVFWWYMETFYSSIDLCWWYDYHMHDPTAIVTLERFFMNNFESMISAN